MDVNVQLSMLRDAKVHAAGERTDPIPSNLSMWDPQGKHCRVGYLQDLQAEEQLVVIHCGARIALNDPLQATLKHNYLVSLTLAAFHMHVFKRFISPSIL
jgi:hypothetical protein